MSADFVALYCRHVGAAYDSRQRFGAALLAKSADPDAPDYDPATATLAFGKLKFEAELLGTFHGSNGSWHWAWGDPHAKLTLTNRALGTVVRASAAKFGAPGFAAAGFAVEQVLGPELARNPGQALGAVLARELGFDTYFEVEVGGLPAVVLVRHKRLGGPERHPAVRLVERFPELVAAVPVPDQRAAFVAFASDLGLEVSEDGDTVRASQGRYAMIARFAGDKIRGYDTEGFTDPGPQSGKPKSKSKAKPAAKPRAKKKPT